MIAIITRVAKNIAVDMITNSVRTLWENALLVTNLIMQNIAIDTRQTNQLMQPKTLIFSYLFMATTFIVDKPLFTNIA